MKKLIAILLVLSFVFALSACGKKNEDNKKTEPQTTETTAEPTGTEATTTEKAEGVMSYAEYAAAELESEVCVDVYVQATQSWWDNKITVYAQDEDGAYFIYEMTCSEEDAAKLYAGTKIRVTGYKAEWAGEVEIMDATFEFLDEEDKYYATYEDVTALLGTDELIQHQNKRVSFKGMTVEASTDAEGNEVPFLYGWDGSGTEGSDSDLYFKASVGGNTYTFVVEYYLTNEESPVYQTVRNLKVGQTVDMEGYLYWYEGVQPHVTSVAIVANAPSMTHEEFVAAQIDDEVCVETYVQATQSWWDNKISIYAQSEDGAYFIYEAACTEEQAYELQVGTKIRVTGFKGEWAGEVEILDAEIEIITDAEPFVAEPVDVTALMGTEQLVDHQNERVSFKGVTIVPSSTAVTEEMDDEGNVTEVVQDQAFLYGWDGSGEPGSDSDLYFKGTVGDETYTFVVEYYLCDETSEVYQAVQNLQIGDVVDLTGFMYWYEGPQAHITALTVAE